MRQVKFRGISVESGELVYGDLFTDHNNHVYILPNKQTLWRIQDDGVEMRAVMTAYKVKPETVGQFTGLKGKNGVEIWEDDLVVTQDADLMVVEWSNHYAGFQYRFMDNGLRLDTAEGPEDHDIVKVLSSVHQQEG